MKEEQKQMLLNQLDQAESLREVKDVFRTYLSNIKSEEEATVEAIRNLKRGLQRDFPMKGVLSPGETINPLPPTS
ncbi:hypothetical protein ANABIO32_02360 [Rossellomorea marisflavi]|uniref:hypothetical protein n=1 Tax=Rossellomorea marisflavi TaxID=189381 RepID=UPI0025C967FD|nr:hypothetical protein [Rossellomorea marisflavi]GLI82549.1 hypothetical protein ANABIO32_02360 [Rossellomorea marisflavi]